jgi:hypothetical protein
MGSTAVKCTGCGHHLEIDEEDKQVVMNGFYVMLPCKTLKKFDYDVAVEEAAVILNKIAEHKEELKKLEYRRAVLAEEMGLQNG